MANFLAATWPILIGLADVAAALAVTFHAVMRKRDTRAVIGWVALAWLAPLLGVFLYVVFGINRVARKGQALGRSKLLANLENLEVTDEDFDHGHRLAEAFPNLVGLSNLVRRLTGNAAVPGNDVVPLQDGDEAYPEMLSAIDGAEKSVGLLTYIFDLDRAGEAFADALLRAHRRGVAVRVLIDDVGARYSRKNMVHWFQQRGIKAAAFLPTRIPRLFKYANLRNHRKILVVDGKLGFTGGTNIREGHWLRHHPKAPVQCLHFRLRGPVVAHLQQTFATDWAFETGESLAGKRWFPPVTRCGPVWARGISGGPDEHLDTLPLTIHAALAAATQQVKIVTPYFLPEAAIIQALNVTSMRGVDVQILLPAINNIKLVQWASTALWWQLLERGCRIHLSSHPFDHTKLFVVDRVWSLVGSTNWDPRSLRLNFEFNVECYDETLGACLARRIDERIARSRQVTLHDVQARGIPTQFRDGLARLLSPYL